MELISQGSEAHPFKVWKADHGLYYTRGLQFELLLTLHEGISAELATDILQWAYRRFYLTEGQKHLVRMLNDDQTFSKTVMVNGKSEAELRAREVPKNDPAVQKCFRVDSDFMQEKIKVRRVKFVLIELDTLFIDEINFNEEEV